MFDKISLDTILFSQVVDKLKELSTKEFLPFSSLESTDIFEEAIVYDDVYETCTFGIDLPFKRYPVVEQVSINELHHDIVSTYSSSYAEHDIQVYVEIGEDCQVVVIEQGDIKFCIEDGQTYCK